MVDEMKSYKEVFATLRAEAAKSRAFVEFCDQFETLTDLKKEISARAATLARLKGEEGEIGRLRVEAQQDAARIVEEAESKASNILTTAEQTKADAERTLFDAQRVMADAKREAADIIASARAQADEIVAKFDALRESGCLMLDTTAAEREALSLMRKVDNAKRELAHERERIVATKAEGNRIVEDARATAKRLVDEAMSKSAEMREAARAKLEAAEETLADAEQKATDMIENTEAQAKRIIKTEIRAACARVTGEVLDKFGFGGIADG